MVSSLGPLHYVLFCCRILKLDSHEEQGRLLEAAIEDLCVDIKDRQREASEVQRGIELALGYLKDEENEYEDILLREDEAKKQLIRAKTAPTNILVAIDSINRQKDELFVSIEDKQTQMENLLLEFALAKEEVKKREDMKDSLRLELEQLEARGRERHNDFNDIERGMNQGLLEQGSYESDFILVDKQIKELTEDMKKENEQLDK